MKKVLAFDNDLTEDYQAIAISSHLKDFKLCWNLNNILKIDLLKKLDFAYTAKKGSVENYSFYFYHNEDLRLTYFLLSNKKNNSQIIEKMPETDYILLINPQLIQDEITLIIQNLKKTTNILTAFLIDLTKIKKDRSSFIHELELHYAAVKKKLKPDEPEQPIDEE